MTDPLTDPLDDWLEQRGTDRDPVLVFADEDFDPWDLRADDTGPDPP